MWYHTKEQRDEDILEKMKAFKESREYKKNPSNVKIDFIPPKVKSIYDSMETEIVEYEMI